MHWFLALLITLLAGFPAAAQSGRIDRVELISMGTYKRVGELKTIKSGDISTGQRTEANWELVNETNTITARTDITFGATLKFAGKPKGDIAKIRVVWHYPEPGITNPDTGKTKLTDEYETTQRIGDESSYCWNLSSTYTHVPGTWRLELWQGDRRLTNQSFKILLDQCRPGGGDDAIKACTEQIERNGKDATAYHNRSTAYKEKGNLDLALADAVKARERDPKNFDYTRTLGFIRYGQADFKAASKDFLRAIELKDDPYSMLFRFLARTRAGDQAGEELEANAGRLKTKEWPYAVTELYLAKRSPQATIDAASTGDERCEAQFYVGQWHLTKGDTTQAKQMLETAVAICPKDFIEADAATAELKTLKP
ncbi:MAG: DUF3859 domain-containing protein [Hyphomicrobiaceae bacterium]